MQKQLITNKTEQWDFLFSFLKYWNDRELSIWGDDDKYVQAYDDYLNLSRQGGVAIQEAYRGMTPDELKGYEIYKTKSEYATMEKMKKDFILSLSPEDFDDIFHCFGYEYDYSSFPEDHEYVFDADSPLETSESFKFPTIISYIIESGFDRCGETQTTLFDHTNLRDFEQCMSDKQKTNNPEGKTENEEILCWKTKNLTKTQYNKLLIQSRKRNKILEKDKKINYMKDWSKEGLADLLQALSPKGKNCKSKDEI